MSLIHAGRMRDDPSSPAIAAAVRRFEADWRSSPGPRPDPGRYAPADAGQRPAVLLELLRADLILHFRAEQRRPLEWYRDAYPELDDEPLVELLYEEYCLREEAGESPEPAEYKA